MSLESVVERIVNDIFSSQTREFQNELKKYILDSLLSLNWNNKNLNEDNLKKLYMYLHRKFVEPGTRIGCLIGQSFMHDKTQKELSAFHLSGDISSGKSLVYPSMEDIFELRNDVNFSLFLYPKDNSEKSCYELLRSLESPNLYEMLKSYEIADLETVYWIPEDEMITFKYLASYEKAFLLTFDKKMMFKFSVTMKEIESYLLKISLFSSVFVSPDFLSQAIVSIESWEKFYDVCKALRNHCLEKDKPCKGITVGSYDNQWYVSMKSVYLPICITKRHIDKSKTFCNDIKQIYNTLGICACREFIIESLSNGKDSNIDFCSVIADYMTWSGIVEPFNKGGVSDTYGPLFDMYYEKPRETLINWLESNKKDNLDNPYSQLMLGFLEKDFTLLTMKLNNQQ